MIAVMKDVSIIAATRQTGTLLAYGNTAGTGALRKAFTEIEGRLKTAA